jgi:hypothetical protein
MCDILHLPRNHIVNTQDTMTFRDQAVAQMRAKKSSTASNKGTHNSPKKGKWKNPLADLSVV